MSAALSLGNDWRYGGPNRDGIITIRVIYVAFVLSLLVHVAALWTSPPLVRTRTFDEIDKLRPSGQIIAQLAPATRVEEQIPPPSPPVRAVPPSRPAPTPQRPLPRPTPAPTPPAPSAPPIPRAETIPGPGPAPPPRPAPQPTPAETMPPVTDLSSYIASRRMQRGEPPGPPPEPSDPNAKPGESEKERLNRTVAANLGLNKTPTFGDDPKRGGGMWDPLESTCRHASLSIL